MWPSIRDLLKNIFFNKDWFEAKFERQVGRVRGLILTLGLASATYADQLADALAQPAWNKRIKIASILLAGASVMIRAGEKNPKPAPEVAAPPPSL